MDFFQAIVLAVIEGITEFLPVSSTGHMILGSSVMGIASQAFTKIFTVAIQFGAILSVVVLYWKRFFKSIDFYIKLLIAFIPAAVLGKLLNDYIDALLENVTVVSVTLLLGGVVFLFIDRLFVHADKEGKTEVGKPSAFIIGLCQCVAMIPGVSRSAATIIGGLSQKLTRQAAAEFSFFLAVPTMFAATAYKIFKFYHEGGHFVQEQWNLLLVGNLVAFVVAMLAIRTFIAVLSRHGFKVFGYYRIALGLTLLILHFAGYSLNIV